MAWKSRAPACHFAVIAFQENEGPPADGVVGDSTWQRMPILRRGSTGNAVASLQKGLLKVGEPGSPTDLGRLTVFRASHRSCGKGVPSPARAGGGRRGRPAHMVGACGCCRSDPCIARQADDSVASLSPLWRNSYG
jgi:hypothetical protein